MGLEQQIDRQKILDETIIEDELSDLKQHADKMIRGFENFNNFSSNRAIWELVQNACDLSTTCEIIIDYRNGGFSFSHNGVPFTTKSLISLIKQVSGKYGDDPEIPEVGKYGTGFLTTHTFGRKFKINSILKANNAFFEIKDFLIDRSPKEWKELSSNIKTQKDNVYKLIKEGIIISTSTKTTTFTYIPESQQEFEYIKDSKKDIEDYVPIILTFNDRIKKLNILNDDYQICFERAEKIPLENEKGINLFKTTILKNEVPIILYSIVDTEDEIEIILPIDKNLELFQFKERIARLFLYYPLIGSENFGINFVINCNKFLPTEQRDGIHLKSNKDQVKDQETENRKIIEKASNLIFSFLKSNVVNVSNPLLYAKINFKRNSDNSLLNEYFEGLQNTWTNEFKLFPFVETTDGFKPVNEACFFSHEIIEKDDYFDDIYELAIAFKKNLPVKSRIVQWSHYVNEWVNDDINFIGHENIVSFIATKHLDDFEKKNLINYYSRLINEEKTIYFSDFTLTPNLDGKFFQTSTLVIPKDLNDTLIEIGRFLIPNSIEKLVHNDFRFNFKFDDFNRKNFSNNVKTALDDLPISEQICTPKNFSDENYNNNIGISKKLDYDFFLNLVKYCKLNNNINSQSKPTLLLKILCRYYSIDENLILLSNLEEQESNIVIRYARKVLVQVFFNIIQYHNSDWVEKNLELLLHIANCYDDSYKEVYLSSNIYPSQANKLKSINELKRDINILPEIKDLYNNVKKCEIRNDLIYGNFNDCVAEDRSLTNKSLTTEIEDIFFNTDIKDINKHPFKDEILNIISKLRDKNYADLFPRLDDKKANLMLEVVTNESTKDDIFSIVTLKESQLKKLGKLVQEPNFDTILDLANSLMQQKIESDANFRHKYEIGRNIENLIRENLSIELQDRISFDEEKDLDASDIQGGQDVIIFLDGKPIYFIEVKSRWDSNNSVSMSKLQLQRAVEEEVHYALCSVDITRYSGNGDKYKLPIEEILSLTKFVTNIGHSVKPLIENNLIAEKNQDNSIHLIEYRGIIPQKIIELGSDFHGFIEMLISIINKTVNSNI